ncbi:MAG: T9SS type A sorting domain-containing protein [Candidatus Cloacimonetes bacterium]|nr:T9SS type A sorting domain-containing protein [Candidatus Cloacimonadota bacterium]
MKKSIFFLLLIGLIFNLSAELLWQEAIPIRQGVNIEWFRTGTQTTDGCAIYVWSDTKLGERDLWAQKVDAQGNAVWGEPLLIDGKPDRQEDPVITMTSDNNFVIAWIDFSDDLDGNVYAQKINAEGQLLWQTGGVPVCTYSNIQISLNMEADNEGGVYIIWVDFRNPGKDLYGQHLNSSGTPLWQTNGIPIANDIGDEEQNTMLPDGQGGFIIAYTYSFSDAEDIFAKRFLPDGTMAWQQPTILSNATGNQGKVRMAKLTNGEFVFVWEDQRSEDPDIYAQKIDLDGNILWQDPFIVFGDSGTENFAPQLNPRIVATSDNAVIIVWEDKRLDGFYTDLFAQKISASGNLMWNPDGVPLCVAEFAQSEVRLASDSNGGCYMVWDDLRNGDTPNDDIYGQHLSATGTALWTANGQPICNAANQQNSALIKISNDMVFINWMDMRNGSVGLYYQVYNSQGVAQLSENGQLVFWGLSGDTPLDNYLILPRSQDVVIIWQDTRFANMGYRIFCQFLNPDGSVDLELNGQPVTLNTGANQSSPAATVLSDDSIVIAWVDARDESPKIYLQHLDANGNRLWGDYGIPLTESTPIEQKEPRVSYKADQNQVYIGWSNYDNIGGIYRFYVYGQMIQNEQKQWGPDGIKISYYPEQDFNYHECTLYDLKENYYSWQDANLVDYTKSVFAKKVEASGETAQGWPDSGLQISTYPTYIEDCNQGNLISTLTDEGIFCMWGDQRSDSIENYYGQHISPNGERLWDPLGVNLADYGREQSYATIADNPLLRNDIVFAWTENIGGMGDIIAQKYSLDGVPQWGNLGIYVVQKDSTQTNPYLARFNNGGMVITWTDFYNLITDESNINYKYINSNGTIVGDDSGGYIICDAKKNQYNPKIAIINNEAYVIWADGRSSGKTEILGLYAQKLSNETTAINDPVIPSISKFTLLQNSPNPFNPSTNIQFIVNDITHPYNLNIYNIKGQLIKTLVKGNLEKGTHNIVWDGTDNNGNNVSSGIYLYSLSSGKSNQIKRMVLMK